MNCFAVNCFLKGRWFYIVENSLIRFSKAFAYEAKIWLNQKKTYFALKNHGVLFLCQGFQMLVECHKINDLRLLR